MCGLLLVACLAGALAVRRAMLQNSAQNSGAQNSYPLNGATGAAEAGLGAVPDRNLTPGTTRVVSFEEVCSMAHEEVIKDVSAELRHRVFAEYGIANARADDYEVDYLIAPGLGGADDIHNLWPQPYRVPTWNAHAKDALEERLHQLVCARRLDLPTAQHEIATDWIAAYKKYVSAENAGLVPTAFGSPAGLVPSVAAVVPLELRRE